jgi:hypothetical protein
MRLRVALHFSCPDAVDYDHKRPEPRWALIKKHIEECFTFEPNETERISRLVATVLDEWDVKRVHGLATRRSKLLERQNHRFASCHIDFLSKARVNQEELESLEGTSDPFKPYFDGNGVADAMRPEVDHISVVSRDGTNLSDNLQILCGLCNQGKSDGTGVRTSKELEYLTANMLNWVKFENFNSLPNQQNIDLYEFIQSLKEFVEPFKLNSETAKKPSSFEVIFILVILDLFVYGIAYKVEFTKIKHIYCLLL